MKIPNTTNTTIYDTITDPLIICTIIGLGFIIYYIDGYVNGPADDSSDTDSLDSFQESGSDSGWDSDVDSWVSSQNSDLNSLGSQLISVPSNIDLSPFYSIPEYIYNGTAQYLSQYSYLQLMGGAYAVCVTGFCIYNWKLVYYFGCYSCSMLLAKYWFKIDV